MESTVLVIGSLVYVTCYGPCWGCRGIVQAIDVIELSDGQSESLCFYLVALQEGEIREPVWFVHDDIVGVEGESVSLRQPKQRFPLEIEVAEVAVGVLESMQDEQQGVLLGA